MSRNDCAVLITSCDKYEDAWNPFFTLFHKQWNDCPFPVYLNTETKSYSHKDIDIICLHPMNLIDKRGNCISWSERLRQCLLQIDAPYILFSLEDFFLLSSVRTDIVEKCLAYMKQSENVAVVDFYSEPCVEDMVIDEFSSVDSKYDYCINTMMALWRKDFLLSILRDESPWEFEFRGTYRWRRKKMIILTHRKEYAPVFDYKIKPEYGLGIYQGKWLRGNIKLFEKNGIIVDFDNLGFVDPPNLVGRAREKNWFWRDVIKTIKSPRLLGHYIGCMRLVVADKIRRIKAKFFNL